MAIPASPQGFVGENPQVYRDKWLCCLFHLVVEYNDNISMQQERSQRNFNARVRPSAHAILQGSWVFIREEHHEASLKNTNLYLIGYWYRTPSQ